MSKTIETWKPLKELSKFLKHGDIVIYKPKKGMTEEEIEDVVDMFMEAIDVVGVELRIERQDSGQVYRSVDSPS